MRKNRVEIFFVLYLTALVGFVVVSKERDKHDVQIEEQKDRFLRSFFKPVSLELQSDTIWWYVDAAEGSKVFRTAGRPFIADLKIHDIGPADSVIVQIASVTHNNLLVSPRLIRPIGRRAFGDLHDRTVRYPLECVFSQLGVYTVSLAVKSRRIHPSDDRHYMYRDIKFPQSLLPDVVKEDIESTHGAFTIIVEDTSIANPMDVPNLTLTPQRLAINSSLGYQESNTLDVNLGFYNPRVRIVGGHGLLRRVTKDSRTETYEWTGPVLDDPYEVTIEARVNRRAGGKDIARTSFIVSSQFPYLVERKPEFAYSGETFETNIKVAGLDDEALYAWELHEAAGGNALLSKLSGKGPNVRYHVPTGFAGKLLVVQAKYRGLPYVQFDPVTGRESSSRFDFPVIDPPVHIELSGTDVLYASGIQRFTAYKYSQPEYRFDQPVMDYDKVHVQLTTETGKPILTNIRMNSPGRFEFAIVYQGDIPYEGIPVRLKIGVNGAVLSRSVRLKK